MEVGMSWHGDKVLRNQRKAGAKGLKDAAEYALSAANLTVPHRDGDLERSGATDVDPDAQAASVYYTAIYAPVQHEDMSLTHDGKGEAKWLENTLTAEQDFVAAIVAQAIRDGLGT